MTSAGLTILNEAECMKLLRDGRLGRVGVHLGTEFSIFPVYYALLDRNVVFRTAPGSKMNAAVLRAQVVFEVDDASEWSVLVRGHAGELREDDDVRQARELLGNAWPAGEREHYVKISIEQISGRRVPAGVSSFDAL